jgi:hypothetical protein
MEGPDRLEREMHEKVDVDAFAASYCKKLCGQAIGRVLGRRSGAWPVPSNNVTPVCSMWDASSIHINDDLLSKYNNHSSGRSSFGEKSWKSAVALNLLVGAGGLHRVGSHSLESISASLDRERQDQSCVPTSKTKNALHPGARALGSRASGYARGSWWPRAIRTFLGMSMSKDKMVNTSIDGKEIKRALITTQRFNDNHWFNKSKEGKVRARTIAHEKERGESTG